MKMLDFECKIFQDLIDTDGLYIFAKGLNLDSVLLNFFKYFSDPGNLVLVINCEQHSSLFSKSVLSAHDVAHIYHSCHSLRERVQQYFKGGIHFVSTQTLVLDLLKHRIPVEKITGVLVFEAHSILESCQEAFALRLYRQKNRTGFVKAFSDRPENFLYGYGHLEKIMRSLFLKEVFFWPRFHKTIQSCLDSFRVSVNELHIEPLSSVINAQMCILHLMNSLIKDIKSKNRFVDLQEITVENFLTKSFYKIIELQLHPVWYQLSQKTIQNVNDLKTLQFFIRTLYNDDFIRFFGYLNECRSVEYSQKSTWVLTESGQKLLTIARNLLFNTKNELSPESPSKWKTLIELLKSEIMSETKKQSELKSAKILILCQSTRSCDQLRGVLLQGPEKFLLNSIIEEKIPFTTVSDSFLPNEKEFLEMSVREYLETSSVDDANNSSKSLLLDSVENEVGKTETADQEKDDGSETEADQKVVEVHFLTMSQKSSANSSGGVFFESIEPFTQMDNLDLSTFVSEEPLIMIQAFDKYRSNKDVNLRKTLEEMKPNYIIMYHSSHTVMRQIEVFKAKNPEVFLRVYMLVYTKSVEEQIHLTELRREKQAFEVLIDRKSKMLVPEYEFEANDEETATNGKSLSVGEMKPVVIVDSREFRSELPAILHKKKFELEVNVLIVGDYVLTPDVCIERKSISDLIGSLRSGRLFEQCTKMSRFYSKPMLLIEFDKNKAFHFMSGVNMMAMGPENHDIQEKLQLLTLHFPKLKLLWSPNPYATAQLFEEIKEGKEQPNLEKAIAAGIGDIDEEHKIFSYNTKIFDFLLKLPGITNKNIDAIMRKGRNFNHLLSMSMESFQQDFFMNSEDAELFYSTLHKSFAV